ncbi:hypothetical protein ES703_77604 [subsurface metagenome]
MKRKRLLVIVGSVCLSLMLVASLLAGCAPEEEEEVVVTPEEEEEVVTPEEEEEEEFIPVVLSYSDNNPPKSLLPSEGIDWFCSEVERRTDGRVAFETYYGGSLLSLPEGFDGCGAGIADMATMCVSYSPAEMSLGLMGSLIFMAPTSDVAVRAWQDLRDSYIWPAFEQELAAQNVTTLFTHPQASVQLMLRDQRVTCLEDLQGLNLRGDAILIEVWKALGAVPVALSFAEIYGAMSTGTVDGSQGYSQSIIAWKFDEVADYWVLCNLGAAAADCGGIINLDLWNSLPPDIQAIMRQVGREAALRYTFALAKAEAEGVRHFEETGGEVIVLSPAERDRWFEIAKPAVVESVREKAIAQGLPWDEAFELFMEYIERYE